jgi:hypothetical protein
MMTVEKIFYASAVSGRYWTLLRHFGHILDGTRVPEYGMLLVNNPNEDTLRLVDMVTKRIRLFNSDRARTGLFTLEEHREDFPNEEFQHRSTKGVNPKKYNTRMSYLRNYMIDQFLETDCTQLFFCDSDIYIRDNVLERLSNIASTRSLTCVAAVVRNGAVGIYNYLMRRPDGKGYTRRPFAASPVAGLTDVDLTGACWIVPRSAVLTGYCRYGHSVDGNDAYFCEKLIRSGYRLLVDSGSQTLHHMEKDENALNSHTLPKDLSDSLGGITVPEYGSVSVRPTATDDLID